MKLEIITITFLLAISVTALFFYGWLSFPINLFLLFLCVLPNVSNIGDIEI